MNNNKRICGQEIYSLIPEIVNENSTSEIEFILDNIFSDLEPNLTWIKSFFSSTFEYNTLLFLYSGFKLKSKGFEIRWRQFESPVLDILLGKSLQHSNFSRENYLKNNQMYHSREYIWELPIYKKLAFRTRRCLLWNKAAVGLDSGKLNKFFQKENVIDLRSILPLLLVINPIDVDFSIRQLGRFENIISKQRNFIPKEYYKEWYLYYVLRHVPVVIKLYENLSQIMNKMGMAKCFISSLNHEDHLLLAAAANRIGVPVTFVPHGFSLVKTKIDNIHIDIQYSVSQYDDIHASITKEVSLEEIWGK